MRLGRSVGAIALVALLAPLFVSTALGSPDDDQATSGDWVFLATLTALVAASLVPLRIIWRRRINQYTRLPSPVRGKRARGPLRRGRLN